MVIPVETFNVDPLIFVNTTLEIVEFEADNIPVDTLIVAKMLLVVIPPDARNVPLTSSV